VRPVWPRSQRRAHAAATGGQLTVVFVAAGPPVAYNAVLEALILTNMGSGALSKEERLVAEQVRAVTEPRMGADLG
jgi:hypothetical protein